MTKTILIFGSIILLSIAGSAIAQEPKNLEVEDMVFCTSVEERQPVGTDTVFADTVGQVFCYTKIVGATDTLEVSHVWYFENEEKARINLSVKAKSWRTWSSKRFVKEWDGLWRVDVLGPNGQVIKSKSFNVRKTTK